MPKRIVPDLLQKQYMSEVIDTAMDVTLGEYGPYQVAPLVPAMLRERVVAALEKGTKINVYINPLKTEFIGKVHIVPIPIRRGILNYRLPLIREDNLTLFARTDSVEKLRRLKVGMYANSATLVTLNQNHYNVVEAPTHEAMFPMLVRGRFDYTVRGVHEVFYELLNRRNAYPELIVEPTIAIDMPLPTVVYISLEYPRLAKRLETGLTEMAFNGKLKEIFNKYYKDYVLKARLHERRIFHIENPLLNEVKFPPIPGLWFSQNEMMLEEMTGL